MKGASQIIFSVCFDKVQVVQKFSVSQKPPHLLNFCMAMENITHRDQKVNPVCARKRHVKSTVLYNIWIVKQTALTETYVQCII